MHISEDAASGVASLLPSCIGRPLESRIDALRKSKVDPITADALILNVVVAKIRERDGSSSRR